MGKKLRGTWLSGRERAKVVELAEENLDLVKLVNLMASILANISNTGEADLQFGQAIAALDLPFDLIKDLTEEDLGDVINVRTSDLLKRFNTRMEQRARANGF